MLVKTELHAPQNSVLKHLHGYMVDFLSKTTNCSITK